MMITVERVSGQVFRVTLTAEVRISGSTDRPPGRVSTPKAAEPAELLQVGRDKVYYLLRTGQLRSIKIGKLRRVSRAWITEFLTARLSEDDPLHL